MCLIAFAIGASPRWPFVLAANRDEFRQRPTAPLARWRTPTGLEVLSGRDLRAGGTWLGITPGGRIAFLTNVREAGPAQVPRSRGELVLRWLEAGPDALDAETFAARLRSEAGEFGGFNLVLGDFQQQSWTWLSNKPAPGSSGGPRLFGRALTPGIYGVSNASLDTPWPKTLQLKTALTDALHENSIEALKAPLWAALADRRRAPLDALPSTGVPAAVELALSSAFVDMPERDYGTRSSTLIVASLVDDPQQADDVRHWELQVEEQTSDPSAATAGHVGHVGLGRTHWLADPSQPSGH